MNNNMNYMCCLDMNNQYQCQQFPPPPPPCCQCYQPSLPQQNKSRKKRRPGKYVPPVTPPDRKAVVFEPCVHLHFKEELVDRECLTREQYVDMLATPKGYPWMEENNTRSEKKACKTKNKRKCKRMKSETKLCTESSPAPDAGGDFADEFVENMWDVMSPDITCRLIDFLVNEFGMSVEEAEDFIDCKSCIGKQNICKGKKSKDIISFGPRTKWIKAFSDIFANRIEQYIVGMLMTRRTPRTKRIGEKILDSLCNFTGEKTTLQNPKSKTQKVSVLVANRLALWVEDILKDIDKPLKKRVTISEEKSEEEEEEEEEDEEEEEEEEKEPKKEDEEKREEAKEKPKREEPTEEERVGDQEEGPVEKQEEPPLAPEEPAAEEPAKEEAAEQEPPPPVAEEPAKEEEAKEEPPPAPAEEPAKEEEAKAEELTPAPAEEAAQEEVKEEEPPAVAAEEPPVVEEQPAAVEESPAPEVAEEAREEEAAPVAAEEVPAEEAPAEVAEGEEEVAAEGEEGGAEEVVAAEEAPIEVEEAEEEAPEEKPAEEEKEPEEVPKEVEKTPYGDILDLVKDDIAGIPKDRKTERQQMVKGVVDKRMRKMMDGREMDVTDDELDDAASRVAHWAEHVLGAAEPKPGVVQGKSPGKAFKVQAKTGSTLDIQKMSSGTVARETAKARGVEAPLRARKISESVSPMDVKSAQEWVDWASNIANVADEWGKWLDGTLTDAERRMAGRKKEGADSDWKQWKESTQTEAQKWRVERERIKDEGKLWESKLEKKPKDETEREVKITDME